MKKYLLALLLLAMLLPAIAGCSSSITQDQTSAPQADETTEAPTVDTDEPSVNTEEVTTELDTSTPGNSGQALQEFIADRTAQAVAEAIMDRMGDIMGDTMMGLLYDSMYNSIYDSVYNAMMDDEGFMNRLMEEMIPGYGQLSGILGGLGQ